MSTQAAYDPTKCLADDLKIISAGNHFYRIGLSNFVIGSDKRNKIFVNTCITIVTQLILLARSLVSIAANERDPNFFVMLGDFPYFLNIRYQGNLILTSFYLLTIICVALHYQRFKKNIWPTYMRPFRMMSGHISPQSVGLTDKTAVIKLLKLTQTLFKLFEINVGIIYPTVAFTLNLIAVALNCDTFIQIIVFAIPWSVLYTYGAHFMVEVIVWQFVYFYLLCYYFKLKVTAINEQIRQQLTEISDSYIAGLLDHLQTVYSEIDDYNHNYWSVFAFWLYVSHSTVVCLFLYSSIFGDMNSASRGMTIYATALYGSVIFLFMKTAASVCAQIKITFKLLISVQMRFRRSKSNFANKKLKLSSFVERVGQNKIGFYCWKLFIIDYFRFYEVIGLMAVYFLKVIEISLKH